MSDVVLLHDLGAEEAGEPWRAVAPSGWHAPDLPGHGSSPAPRHGAYDPMSPATLARWALGGAGVVVGIGQNAHGALILAAGGGCDAVVIVDGLWGPWPDCEVAIEGMYANLRAIVADELSTDPAPRSGLDPRTTHGYGVNVSAAFVQRFWGAITCPVLALETPASTTPADEREARTDWFGGPVTLAPLTSSAPVHVVRAVSHWRSGVVGGGR